MDGEIKGGDKAYDPMALGLQPPSPEAAGFKDVIQFKPTEIAQSELDAWVKDSIQTAATEGSEIYSKEAVSTLLSGQEEGGDEEFIENIDPDDPKPHLNKGDPVALAIKMNVHMGARGQDHSIGKQDGDNLVGSDGSTSTAEDLRGDKEAAKQGGALAEAGTDSKVGNSAVGSPSNLIKAPAGETNKPTEATLEVKDATAAQTKSAAEAAPMQASSAGPVVGNIWNSSHVATVLFEVMTKITESLKKNKTVQMNLQNNLTTMLYKNAKTNVEAIEIKATNDKINCNARIIGAGVSIGMSVASACAAGRGMSTGGKANAMQWSNVSSSLNSMGGAMSTIISESINLGTIEGTANAEKMREWANTSNKIIDQMMSQASELRRADTENIQKVLDTFYRIVEKLMDAWKR